MADYITEQQLENAFEDANDLADIVNGSAVINGTGLVPTRLNGSVPSVRKAIADAQDFLAGEIASDLRLLPTTGERIQLTRAVASPDPIPNGAVARNVAGRRVGYTIPAGSTGTGAYTVLRIPFDLSDIQTLTGCTIRIRTIMEASTDFITAIPFGGNAVRVDRMDGSVSANEGTQTNLSQAGNKLVRDFEYVVVGNETDIGANMQIGTHAAAGTEHYFEIKSVVVDIMAVPAMTGESAADRAISTRINDLFPSVDVFTDFESVDDVTYLSNSAVAILDQRNRRVGLSLATGQTGQNSILQFRLTLNGRLRAMLAGEQVRMTFAFETSEAWNRAHTLNMQIRDTLLATSPIVTSNVIDIQISPTRRIMSFTFLVPDNVTIREFQPYIQLTSGTGAAAAETIRLTDFALSIYRTTSTIEQSASMTDILGDEFARLFGAVDAMSQLSETGDMIGARFKSSDYASIKAASVAATGAAAPGDVALVDVPEGVFVENSIGLTGQGGDGDNVSLRGKGRRRTIINSRLAANTAIATIQATSALDYNGSNIIQDMTALAENCRYGFHIDPVKFKPNRHYIARNIEVIHYGNDAANAYWGQTTWASPHGIAIGTCSGSRYTFENCKSTAPRAAFSAHNQVDFADPSIVEAIGCDFTATWKNYWSVRLESLGSRVMDRFKMWGCALSGDISITATPWLPTTLDKMPADHREWDIAGYGNSPAVVRVDEWGRALRIVSATSGTASKVQISGTAAPILFGDTSQPRVTQVDGDIGMQGYAYGWADISADTSNGRPGAITSLSARLGNRTSSPVTLTVQIDALAAVNIVFNANYAGMTNAQILDIINTALASTGTASEYNVGGRYKPMFTDEERSLRNASGTTIFMGMALAYGDNGRLTVRPMTSNDTFDRFAGVAWQDIRPGSNGRVKTGGWIDRSDVLRSDGGAIDLGERFSIDPAKPGYVLSGQMRGEGILPCVRSIAGQDAVALSVEPGSNGIEAKADEALLRGQWLFDQARSGPYPSIIDRSGGTSIEFFDIDNAEAAVQMDGDGVFATIDTLNKRRTDSYDNEFSGNADFLAPVTMSDRFDLGGTDPRTGISTTPEFMRQEALERITGQSGETIFGIDGLTGDALVGPQKGVTDQDGYLWRHPSGAIRATNKVGWYTGEHSYLSEPVPPPQCVLSPLIVYPDEDPSLATRVYILIPSVAKKGGRLFFAWCGDALVAEEGAGNFIILAYSDDEGTTKTEFAYVLHPEPTLGRTMMPQLWLDQFGNLQLVFSMNYAYAGIAGGDDRHGAWCVPINSAMGAKPRLGRPWQIATYGIPGRPAWVDDRFLINVDLVENGTAGLPYPGPISYWRGKSLFEINTATRSGVKVGHIQNSTAFASYQESSTVQLRDGSLLTSFRTRDPGGTTQISRSPSGEPNQYGALENWSALPPNTTSRAALVMSYNGRPLVAFNSDPNNRTNMTLAVLNDDGSAILQSVLIDQLNGSSSYPSIWSEGDNIYVVYDVGRTSNKQIIMAKVSEQALVAGTAAPTYKTIEDQ